MITDQMIIEIFNQREGWLYNLNYFLKIQPSNLLFIWAGTALTMTAYKTWEEFFRIHGSEFYSKNWRVIEIYARNKLIWAEEND